MISLRLALTRREDRRLTKPSVPAKASDVLGMDLNCSESGRPERLTGGWPETESAAPHDR